MAGAIAMGGAVIASMDTTVTMAASGATAVGVTATSAATGVMIVRVANGMSTAEAGIAEKVTGIATAEAVTGTGTTDAAAVTGTTNAADIANDLTQRGSRSCPTFLNPPPLPDLQSRSQSSKSLEALHEGAASLSLFGWPEQLCSQKSGN
jgi:hypothetical protein